MKYEYIRRLTKGIDKENCEKMAKELLSRGIEVYEKQQEDFYKSLELTVLEQNETDSGAFQGDLYVSAADLDYARACVKELHLETYLCPMKEIQPVKSEVEKAEEEYYRKRKIRMIECAIVIAAGMLYLLYKSLAG